MPARLPGGFLPWVWRVGAISTESVLAGRERFLTVILATSSQPMACQIRLQYLWNYKTYITSVRL